MPWIKLAHWFFCHVLRPQIILIKKFFCAQLYHRALFIQILESFFKSKFLLILKQKTREPPDWDLQWNNKYMLKKYRYKFINQKSEKTLLYINKKVLLFKFCFSGIRIVILLFLFIKKKCGLLSYILRIYFTLKIII